MMLPILISVSVAPTSYFFCASAAVEVATRIASAAEKAPIRNWMIGILISLTWSNVSMFLISELFAAPFAHSIPCRDTQQEKRLRRWSRRRRPLVEQSGSKTRDPSDLGITNQSLI